MYQAKNILAWLSQNHRCTYIINHGEQTVTLTFKVISEGHNANAFNYIFQTVERIEFDFDMHTNIIIIGIEM